MARQHDVAAGRHRSRRAPAPRRVPGRQRHRRLPDADEEPRVLVRALAGRRGSRRCSGTRERRRARAAAASAAQCGIRSTRRGRPSASSGSTDGSPTTPFCTSWSTSAVWSGATSAIRSRGTARSLLDELQRVGLVEQHLPSRPCPSAFRGSGSVRMSQCAGTLKYASASAQNAASSSASSVAPGAGTTTALHLLAEHLVRRRRSPRPRRRRGAPRAGSRSRPGRRSRRRG